MMPVNMRRALGEAGATRCVHLDCTITTTGLRGTRTSTWHIALAVVQLLRLCLVQGVTAKTLPAILNSRNLKTLRRAVDGTSISSGARVRTAWGREGANRSIRDEVAVAALIDPR